MIEVESMQITVLRVLAFASVGLLSVPAAIAASIPVGFLSYDE